MIIKQINEIGSVLRTGTSVKLCFPSTSLPDPKPVTDINYCEYECQQEYTVYSFDSENKSDFFTATEPILLDSDTTEFILIDSSGVEYIITDATYADLVENENMHYCKFNWYRIYNTLGGGRYTIQSKRTSLGVEETQVYGVFLLTAFDADDASDSIVIRGTFNGSLESYGDFKSDNIEFFMRFSGNIISQEAQDSERVLQANRIEVTSHQRKHREFEIEFNHVGFEFQDYLKNIWSMMDEIYIKSYIIMSAHYLEDIRILVNERDAKDSVGTRDLNYIVNAEDALKNVIWHPKE